MGTGRSANSSIHPRPILGTAPQTQRFAITMAQERLIVSVWMATTAWNQEKDAVWLMSAKPTTRVINTPPAPPSIQERLSVPAIKAI